MSARDASGIVCFFPLLGLVLFLLVCCLNFYYRTVPAALARWAEEGGVRVLKAQMRSFFRGPFFWNSSRYQVVYRVRVRDEQAQERWGWVRIGRWWWPDASQIEVEWDPPQPPPIPEDQQPTRGNPLMWDRDLDT
ncbi:MAG: hypothetical protein U0790_12385 [Isosphaeraceae bacterium]